MTAAGALPSRRIYGGLFRRVVQWLRVPDAPELPSRFGDVVLATRPAPGFLRYLKFWYWFIVAGETLFELALVLILGFTAWQGHVSTWLSASLIPPIIVIATVPDIIGFVGVHLRYDTTWYVIGERAVRIRRGVWTITEVTITYENVQNVTVTSGPVQRLFGVSTIIIDTAGAGGGGQDAHGGGARTANQGRIEGVENAEEIRDLIMTRVRASRSAGLGDGRAAPAASTPGFTPDHVEALREIRDLLRAGA